MSSLTKYLPSSVIMLSQTQYLYIVVAALIFLNRIIAYSRRSPLRLPPGPSPLPLIGNVHQVPKAQSWLQYYAWSKKYGSIMHLNLLGQPVIILSTMKAVQDLLAKRGSTYSDRPRLVVASELAMKGLHITFRPYNARYRLHQRMEAPLLNPRASNSYGPLQELESKQLLYDLLNKGGGESGIDCHDPFERMTASTIYALAYGYRLKTGSEAELHHSRSVQGEFVKVARTGVYLVDTFPVLNYLPRFLAPWKREGERLFERTRDLHVGNLRRGFDTPGWNFSKRMRDSTEVKASAMPIEELAFDVGELALAALDTTTMTMDWFVVAWLTQGRATGFVAKAQAYIDQIVGRGRLPAYEDRASLPYIDAIVEEVLRWRPLLTGGLPHAINTEDTYEGYRIPPGSVVIPNYWALTRDVDVFGADVEAFRPERWLMPDEDAPTALKLNDLPTVGFGFGRRICTGRHIARNSLWIQISRLLWAFDVEPGVSETGERVLVDDTKSTDGALVAKPLPFKAVFRPRGPWVRDFIMRDCNTVDVDYVDLGLGNID
ncbi:cytochrome P450 [Xylariaceae sp. FL0662B]|nr:cytochrome P450 [Xylariaceae sp. FL0662B]